MSDWNLFVREARAGSFRGTRDLAMRFLPAYTHTHIHTNVALHSAKNRENEYEARSRK